MSVYGLRGRGKCGAILKYAALIVVVFLVSGVGAVSSSAASDVSNSDDVAQRVICNVIKFVQKLGLPIMTGVILGSSIMAIFGKVSWPAIVMLVVFTGVFFGAGKIMQKFAQGIAKENAGSTTEISAWTCT